jgi:hypothetical protein
MGIHLVVEGGCREGKNAAAAFAHGVAQGRYTVVEGGVVVENPSRHCSKRMRRRDAMAVARRLTAVRGLGLA